MICQACGQPIVRAEWESCVTWPCVSTAKWVAAHVRCIEVFIEVELLVETTDG